MTAPLPAPGWYPDPSGVPGQRYFDGRAWTSHHVPVHHAHARPQPAYQPTAHVEGPNHVLHLILTLITFPLCGGWLWVWLIVAMNNGKRVRYY
jgi:hypothetical protein